MKVVLAEKPSVARDLAAFLNVGRRRDGYFEGKDYQITWAFGHLVELQEPGDYDPALKRWTLASLPFIPETFRLRLRGDEGARKQFATVRRLFRAADSIVCATDAGREGELIFRYILALSDCTEKPVQRLWLKSLTPAAIGSAFHAMRPISEYDNLFAAAQCRSQADWIVGLNATRNYTLRYRMSHGGCFDEAASGPNQKRRGRAGLLWSIGRVQTPVLAMIVRRDDDIRTFVPRPFWELKTTYRQVTFSYTGDRFDQLNDAEQLARDAAEHRIVIKKIQSRTEKSQPPQLYDLTELQRDVNRRYGISAADTLAAAQSLYELKLITYPRTDSRYLSKDMRKDIPRTLEQLRTQRPRQVGKLDLAALDFSARVINDAKITDHHAIIPTGTSPTGLNDRKQKIYDAIATRLIAAFYPECQKEITTVDAVAGEVPFRARGVRVVVAGWTELYPKNPKANANDEPQSLPEFNKNESGPHQPCVNSGSTSAPKHFTENTLLGAMDTAGRLLRKSDDEAELREALREKGLGTPATRAATIETLLHRKYIRRDKKRIMATDLGRYLIAIVRDRSLTSPELTGQWETKLKQVEAGNRSAKIFMQEIAVYTQGIIRSEENDGLDEQAYGPCPRCGNRVVKGKRAFGCSAWRDGCSFVLEPTYRSYHLSTNQLRQLLQWGAIDQPIPLDGCEPCLLALSPNGAVVEIPLPQGDEQDRTDSTTSPRESEPVVSDTAVIGQCPLCGSPAVESPKSFSCSRWREGCGFTIWRTISGKKITPAMAKRLLQTGQTAKLKGFKSKAGKKFDASLKLVGGKVEFEF